MTDPKLHELLDQTRFGDVLTLAHSNGKHTASVSGPVLTDQTHDPAVGIHLLDGDPHVVRTSTGVVWAPVVHAALHRGGEVIAKWDAADHLEWYYTMRAEVRAQALAPIRAALAHHPRCDIRPDDEPIKCGWKRAVADIQAVLDREEQP